MSDYFKNMVKDIQEIKDSIESDTWEFLESDNENKIHEFYIGYNGKIVKLPLYLAEMNDEVQDSLSGLIELINDCYVIDER